MIGPQKKNAFPVFFLPSIDTLPETRMPPENGWLEYYFPFGKAYFSGAMLVLGTIIIDRYVPAVVC